MDVHAGSCFSGNRLRHQRCCAAISGRFIFNDILGSHRIVRQSKHVTQLDFDLHLSASAYFMVVIFDVDAPVLHVQAHLAAQIIHDIHRKRHMITGTVADLVTVIAVFAV